MPAAPLFPDFKQVSLEDRDILREILWAYQPETSELTFTNLFIWQPHYKTRWSLHQDWLVILCADSQGKPYVLQPVGPPGRGGVAEMLLQWLHDDMKVPEPSLERADRKLLGELAQSSLFVVEPRREHFDYVYRASDLIALAGRKYHGKKNHINRFASTYSYAYAPLGRSHIPACLEMQNKWCDCHRCAEDMNLMGEWEAIRDLLGHFEALNIQGGVIMIEGRVEAFTIGELLNEQTAVVHIEKANTAIPGLYSMINQQFCRHAWQAVSRVNREQDLGDEGLRKAKLSYHPDHLVEKFRITLKAV